MASEFITAHGPLTLQDLIDGVGVKASSPSSFENVHIHQAQSLSNCGVDDITYLENRAYLKTLSSVKAKACLVKAAYAKQVEDAGIIAIVVDHPRAAFAKILTKLYSNIEADYGPTGISSSANIDASAHVQPGARIAQNVTIGKQSRIGVGVVIGPNVTIGDNATIGDYCVIECSNIGHGFTVKSHTVIGGAGFGIVYDGQNMIDIAHICGVIIGDNVSIGSHCAIDRGQLENTSIGDGCKLDNYCHIAHGVRMGKNCLIAGQAGISGSCVLGGGVILGGRVGLADHVTIGAGAKLAANCGVMKDVPAGETWSGYPAKPLRQHMREVIAISNLVKKKR